MNDALPPPFAPDGLFHIEIARMISTNNQLAPLQDAHEDLEAEITHLRSLTGCCTERYTPLMDLNAELKVKAQGVMHKFCSVEDQLIALHGNPDGIQLETPLYKRICFLYDFECDQIPDTDIFFEGREAIDKLLAIVQRPLHLIQQFIYNNIGGSSKRISEGVRKATGACRDGPCRECVSIKEVEDFESLGESMKQSEDAMDVGVGRIQKKVSHPLATKEQFETLVKENEEMKALLDALKAHIKNKPVMRQVKEDTEDAEEETILPLALTEKRLDPKSPGSTSSLEEGEGDIRQMDQQVTQMREMKEAAQIHLTAIQSIHENIVGDPRKMLLGPQQSDNEILARQILQACPLYENPINIDELFEGHLDLGVESILAWLHGPDATPEHVLAAWELGVYCLGKPKQKTGYLRTKYKFSGFTCQPCAVQWHCVICQHIRDQPLCQAGIRLVYERPYDKDDASFP